MKICTNKKAYHEYEILDKFEAGIILEGWEAKALLKKRASMNNAFVKVIKKEVILFGLHIASLENMDKEDEDRSRKLLLNKKECILLEDKVNLEGMTIIALEVYRNDKNMFKIQIGLAKGLKKYDKREKDKEKSVKRKMDNYKKEFNSQ
jgi:SsrA-binding protein